jgi:hypothetical protein
MPSQQDQTPHGNPRNNAHEWFTNTDDVTNVTNMGEYGGINNEIPANITISCNVNPLDQVARWQHMLYSNPAIYSPYNNYGLSMLETSFQSSDQTSSNFHIQNPHAFSTDFAHQSAPLGWTQPASLYNSSISALNTSVVPASNIAIAGLLFANYDQAQQAFSQRHVPHNWQPPRSDGSIPTNQTDREKYIVQLMAAFLDISKCSDSDTVKTYQQHWTGTTQDHTDTGYQDLETACWKILEVAEALHRVGPRCLHIFDKHKFRLAYKSRSMRFSQRIQALCDLLRLSKARCSRLLDFDELENTVAAPQYIHRLCEGNKHDNRKRQEILIEGRMQIKEDEHVTW